VGLVAAIFAVVNLPCILAWTAFGAVLRRYLDRPGILRVFNMLMAGLLVASLYPVVIDLVGRSRG